MKNIIRQNISGFTLIELVTSIVIVGVLSLFVSSFIFYEVNNFVFSNSRQQTVQDSRWALQLISKDLRQIVTPDSILYASGDSLSFYNVDTDVVVYTYSGNQILRNGDLLLSSVDSCGFRFYNNEGDVISSPVEDVIDIYLLSIRFITSSNNNATKFSSKVVPRNF